MKTLTTSELNYIKETNPNRKKVSEIINNKEAEISAEYCYGKFNAIPYPKITELKAQLKEKSNNEKSN